jgi:transcriptional regulator with XRE-family HTH domain
MVARIRSQALGHLYIEEWMKALGLTDEKLAERLETNRTTVWRWRSEQKRLNPEKIAAIAQAIGIEPELLWRLPSRPSLDAIVKDASDDMVQKAADVVKILIKTGT